MQTLETTVTCALARWSAGLGDNTLVGWATVAVYVAAALAAIQAARALEGEGPAAGERRFWWVAAMLLAGLAINKQLDLQTLLTVLARCHAELTGWYETRREVQRLFIWSVAGGGLVLLGLLALLLRGALGRVWLALIGLGFVCAFVLIRAASFHHMDGFIGTTALGLKMNWLLELPGPLLVLAVARARRRAALQA